MNVDDALFLKPFFKALEENHVIYAVLRNAEALPDSLNGGDIDILIALGRLSFVRDVVRDVVMACGGKVMGMMHAPHFMQIEMMGRAAEGWWGCCIDLFDGIYSRSVLPLADNELLERRVKTDKGVWTLPEDVGQYLGYVKELINNNKRSERYLAGAKRAIEKGEDKVLAYKPCQNFVRAVIEGRETSARMFVRGWLIKRFLRHPLVFTLDYLAYYGSRFARYFKPCGKMIAVMGTDGSGKSTLLNEIMPLIKTMTHKATVVHHLKPDFLPPLGRLRGVKYEPGHVCTDPHGSKPSGFIGSLVRLTYLSLDYILGYWFKVRLSIAKTPIHYWIFDRYAYDMLIDPLRFRIKLPHWIVRMYLACLPRPDILFCLGGDTVKIYQRKPETSLEDVTRQVEALRALCNRNKGIWVDTTQTLDASVEDMLKGVVKL